MSLPSVTRYYYDSEETNGEFFGTNCENLVFSPENLAVRARRHRRGHSVLLGTIPADYGLAATNGASSSLLGRHRESRFPLHYPVDYAAPDLALGLGSVDERIRNRSGGTNRDVVDGYRRAGRTASNRFRMATSHKHGIAR